MIIIYKLYRFVICIIAIIYLTIDYRYYYQIANVTYVYKNNGARH